MNFAINQTVAYLLVVAGAACWGVTGLFVQQLYDFGLTPSQAVTVRLSFSSLLLFILLFLFARDYLKVRLKDLPHLVMLGIAGISLFNLFYFTVMERATVAIAVVFVYTSPIFAALIARLLYKEALTLQKSIAILLSLTGCAFAIGLLPAGGDPVTIGTILIGLLAGLFCSSYSLLGKYVTGLYHPFTTTFYALLGGALFMLPISQVWEHQQLLFSGSAWLSVFGISIVSTIAAYILFTLGLTHIESSRAAILSSVELVFSVLVSFFILQEMLTGWQAFGIVLVLLSVALTVMSFRRRLRERYPDTEYGWY
ncbi:DMT family transporter [Salisediminibacterium halotolerans]|uniref:Threonine/homoserine efflux transporter RhtA n=1 Tax=Salisediminibacterium halotolerans TaxID=517425 RepID=A0A1H9WE93_9BACI|nr:DMT family transporter [Salisediminibacterium haloalkalitolerans]SES32144.1 Threonine/homoserine efflux transporter RhtA [Salisediminibacterium haloalkalitolerans]